MKTSSFHLNLLHRSEVLSSSPIRLRVMLPVLALLAGAAMALWWAVLFGQLMLVKMESSTIAEELTAKQKSHGQVIAQMQTAQELRLQLEQLDYYSNGVRHVAQPLAHLAEVMPLRVQLTELYYQPLPPQQLKDPKNLRLPPLWGPKENCETQAIVIVGRTTKETPLQSLMESLDDPNFAALLTPKKKINSFRQDSSSTRNDRKLLAFEIEYTAPERRFAR